MPKAKVEKKTLESVNTASEWLPHILGNDVKYVHRVMNALLTTYWLLSSDDMLNPLSTWFRKWNLWLPILVLLLGVATDSVETGLSISVLTGRENKQAMPKDRYMCWQYSLWSLEQWQRLRLSLLVCICYT